MNQNSIYKRKDYLEKQLDLHSDNVIKLSEIISELQSIEHKLKTTSNSHSKNNR